MEFYFNLIVLTASIIFGSISFIVNRTLTTTTKTQKMLHAFLLFFVLHIFIILCLRLMMPDYKFLSLGLPLNTAYAPTFYCCLVLLSEEVKNTAYTQRHSLFVLHFIPTIILLAFYGFFVSKQIDINESEAYGYLILLYSVEVLQYIGYAFTGYFKINKLMLNNNIRLLILRVMWIMIFMALISLGVIFYNNVLYYDLSVTYLALLCFSVVIFNYYMTRLKYVKVVPVSESTVQTEPLIDDQALLKYEKSKLAEEVLIAYKVKVEQVLQDKKSYLKISFTLDDLERESKIAKHHLSQFFSTTYGMNFNAYINKLRVEYAKELLEKRNFDISISELGDECGFNSRTSFFRAFKKYEGVSPSEYIANVLQK
ncbi:helix-turn-helix transcriptional regulator [Myroides sp. 1354]|uniref:helix-turn-helix transcriptional regulator n=1 Tax=unclassified Myroides TaxID=2642485 RepID=UPI0025783A3D|nr:MULTISPECIES: helix-turn-helix transcriptional regulator [unclassified Myroides]MDM1046119.1 helix-turn-helix transcriptional regulator [Myroides sp. R163-1]MDM1057058.1 helix-turn-helix transcriptional regulator [Myroides sp. 1354]MDM1070250.1 helix-turn-helix transcriptional regulator [Myroides sp. 1372]